MITAATIDDDFEDKTFSLLDILRY
jgi:hypothetical protein